MAFIIPENKQSIGRSLLGGIGEGLPQGLQGGLASLLKRKESQAEEESKSKRTQSFLQGIREMGGDNLDFDEQQRLAMKLSGDPALSNAADFLEKREEKQKSDNLSNEEYENIIDDMEGLMGKGGVGWKNYVLGPFSEEAAEFQSKGTALLGLAQRVALKQGIRNQREFDQFLKRTVPNSTDTVSQAKGKLKALRSYLHEGKSKSASINKKLSESTAKKIFQEANGDINKARQRAKELGYEF